MDVRSDKQRQDQERTLKIRWKDAIQLDLENFWTESERGDGQGDDGKN